jgi:hypothetical protein
MDARSFRAVLDLGFTVRAVPLLPEIPARRSGCRTMTLGLRRCLADLLLYAVIVCVSISSAAFPQMLRIAIFAISLLASGAIALVQHAYLVVTSRGVANVT